MKGGNIVKSVKLFHIKILEKICSANPDSFRIIENISWSIFVMLGGLEEIPVDKRDLSRFTSHIRFGLMVAFSIIGAAYYFFNERLLKQKIVWAITSLWLFVFLFVLHLITGIVVFFITITLLLFLLGIKHRKKGVKIITLANAYV